MRNASICCAMRSSSIGYIERVFVKKKSFPLARVYQLLEPGPVTMVTTSYKGKETIMTMTWQTMLNFEPPLVACVIDEHNYSFELLKKSGECVINIPTSELVKTVVAVGSCSGADVDKFEQFGLHRMAGSMVQAPLIEECYAQLECKVIDSRMVKKYNLFIVQVVKAWVAQVKKRPLFLHHVGKGLFVIDGTTVKLPFNKK